MKNEIKYLHEFACNFVVVVGLIKYCRNLLAQLVRNIKLIRNIKLEFGKDWWTYIAMRNIGTL